MDTVSYPAQESNSPFTVIPLTQGYSAVVDKVDADPAQSRWQITRDRYAMCRPRIDGKKIGVLMHRVILERKLGRPLTPKMVVDHINGNGLDNRRSNLREATVAQNARNRKPKITGEEDTVEVDIRAITNNPTPLPPVNGDLPLDAPFVSIPLNLERFALVDLIDADLANVKWFLNCGRYARRRTEERGNGRHHSMHRIILERKLGRPIKEGLRVDHINGDGLDNRRENLREATQGQNMRNLRLRRDNTSQYKGVRHLGPHGWEARVDEQTIGYFDTAKDASFAYDRAALEQYGEFALLNHPLEEVLAWVPPVRQFGKKSASGYRGVQACGDRWGAEIKYNSQRRPLGFFDTAEEAAFAYDKAALELYGEKAQLNHPVEQVQTWTPPARLLRKTNTSGYRGVQKLGTNRWYAQIHANRQVIYLGTFDRLPWFWGYPDTICAMGIANVYPTCRPFGARCRPAGCMLLRRERGTGQCAYWCHRCRCRSRAHFALAFVLHLLYSRARGFHPQRLLKYVEYVYGLVSLPPSRRMWGNRARIITSLFVF